MARPVTDYHEREKHLIRMSRKYPLKNYENIDKKLRLDGMAWALGLFQELSEDHNRMVIPMAMAMTDQYICKHSKLKVKNNRLLIGVAMIMSSEVHEIIPLCFSVHGEHIDENLDLLTSTELAILKTLKLTLTYPTVYNFVDLYHQQFRENHPVTKAILNKEINLLHYLALIAIGEMLFLKFPLNVVGEACVFLVLEHFSPENQLVLDCAGELRDFFEKYETAEAKTPEHTISKLVGVRKAKLKLSPQTPLRPYEKDILGREPPSKLKMSFSPKRYTPEKQKIGSGTYGFVYRAVFKPIDEAEEESKVVIKKFQEDISEGISGATLRELSILKELEHPNIVKILDVFVGKSRKDSAYNDTVSMVMESADGDLEQYLENSPKLSLKQIKHIGRQLISAIDYLHRKDIIHRDLKVQNILYKKIDQHKIQIKLADFGLARNILQNNGRYTPGMCTANYCAPEMLDDKGEYDKPSDIWSVGCILAELYRSQRTENLLLFPGHDHGEMMDSIKSVLVMDDRNEYKPAEIDEVLPEISYRSALPRYFMDLLYNILQFDPKRRLSASEILDHPFFQ